MKRELKLIILRWSDIRSAATLQSLSRWKGNWNFKILIHDSLFFRHDRLQSLSRWKGNWNISSSSSYRCHKCWLQSLSRWKGNWNTAIFLAIVRGAARALQSLSRWKGNWNPGGHNTNSGLMIWLQSLSRWKGNWNTILVRASMPYEPIAEPIPMKRELKHHLG